MLRWLKIRRNLAVLVGASFAAALVASMAQGPSLVFAAERAAWHDYNGDGFADLAIGIPGETIGGHAGAGAVEVLYGSANGTTTAGSQFLDENSSVMGTLEAGGAAAGDHFGTALASGDFDGDGIGDLAIGVPGADDAAGQGVGAVIVLWGSANGLSGPALEFAASEAGDHIGSAMVALDCFAPDHTNTTSGDGIADLAFVAHNSLRITVTAGGSRTFLSGAPQHAEVFLSGPDDRVVLAAGQVDGDAMDELFVGQPDAPVTSNSSVLDDVGTVVLADRTTGFDEFATTTFTEKSFGGTNKAGDLFGSAIVTGQFLGSPASPEEVLIGAPGKAVAFNGSKIAGAGMVMFVIGASGVERTEASSGIPGDPHAGDAFGSSLAVGLFDSGGVLDIAIGAPGVPVGGATGAGAVTILRDGGPDLRFTQDSTGIAGNAAADDGFGAVLTAADFGQGGRDDLAIGVPDDNEPNGVSDAGVVNVLYGAASGPSGSNDRLWSQATTGIANAPGAGDRLGAALR